MKLNFDFTIKNLDGTDIQLADGTPLPNTSKLLANWIMNAASSSPAEIAKYYAWASELYSTAKIDLDQTGKKDFQTFVESLPNVSVLIKGQILDVIKNTTE